MILSEEQLNNLNKDALIIIVSPQDQLSGMQKQLDTANAQLSDTNRQIELLTEQIKLMNQYSYHLIQDPNEKANVKQILMDFLLVFSNILFQRMSLMKLFLKATRNLPTILTKGYISFLKLLLLMNIMFTYMHLKATLAR